MSRLLVLVVVLFCQINGEYSLLPEYGHLDSDFIYLRGDDERDSVKSYSRTFSFDLSDYRRVDGVELTFDYMNADAVLGYSTDLVNLKVIVNNQLFEQIINSSYNEFDTYRASIGYVITPNNIINVTLQQSRGQHNFDGVIIKDLRLKIRGTKN